MFIGRATRPQALILLNLKIAPAAGTCGLDLCSEAVFIFFRLAVYKSGTGTRGRGHRDACVRTWDLATRDEGLKDLKYGTRGRVGRGRGDVKYRDAGDAGCE